MRITLPDDFKIADRRCLYCGGENLVFRQAEFLNSNLVVIFQCQKCFEVCNCHYSLSISGWSKGGTI